MELWFLLQPWRLPTTRSCWCWWWLWCRIAAHRDYSSTRSIPGQRGHGCQRRRQNYFLSAGGGCIPFFDWLFICSADGLLLWLVRTLCQREFFWRASPPGPLHLGTLSWSRRQPRCGCRHDCEDFSSMGVKGLSIVDEILLKLHRCGVFFEVFVGTRVVTVKLARKT